MYHLVIRPRIECPLRLLHPRPPHMATSVPVLCNGRARFHATRRWPEKKGSNFQSEVSRSLASDHRPRDAHAITKRTVNLLSILAHGQQCWFPIRHQSRLYTQNATVSQTCGAQGLESIIRVGVTRRKHHRPGIAPNTNTTHVRVGVTL